MEKNNNHGRFFTVEQTFDVMCLHFTTQSEYFPGMLTDIVNELMSFLSDQEKRPSKALVLYPPPGILSPDRFEKIMAAPGIVCSNEPIHRQDPMTQRAMEQDFIREINASHRLIKGIRRIDDFVVAALSGKTVLSLFGPALACDLRVVSKDFVLINRMPYSRLTPWGALPWFLSRILGRAKAWALLAEEKDINADQAFDLGLVDRIVPTEQLKGTSVTLAQIGAARPWTIRVALKQAMSHVDASLEQYLEIEKSLFLSSFEQRSTRFSEGGDPMH
ncbi:MAG: enoyl-CoA hydratase/isomerase family protein [Kiritimatiellae bacterium]|nr:enoyl-CoA hydratase/isomerase family protein [Kiritimatiellia bacterium]